MIVSTIKNMAKRREITNASQLATETGLHPAVAYKLWGDKTRRVDFDTLDRLCRALKCQPSQLLRFSENGKPAKKR